MAQVTVVIREDRWSYISVQGHGDTQARAFCHCGWRTAIVLRDDAHKMLHAHVRSHGSRILVS